MQAEKFERAIALIDRANKADPNQEVFNGQRYPKELLYSQRMTACLLNFYPEASEALLLAARAQHICRWKIPRNAYPMDRVGYHAWRNTLKKFHAQTTALLLSEAGYDANTIKIVEDLLQKKQLRSDKETQTLEDVICLVFLEYYLEAFAKDYPQEKLISILQKTWRKMSYHGQQAALKLPYNDSIRSILEKALS